jgi:hypothetical protein
LQVQNVAVQAAAAREMQSFPFTYVGFEGNCTAARAEFQTNSARIQTIPTRKEETKCRTRLQIRNFAMQAAPQGRCSLSLVDMYVVGAALNALMPQQGQNLKLSQPGKKDKKCRTQLHFCAVPQLKLS